VGKATLSGRVVDLSDIPLAQMVVTCAESDASFTTGADGKWTLEVPADTSLTLRAVPLDPLNVYKANTVGPIQLADRTVITDFDILSVPGSTIGLLNAIAGGDENRGVLAVKVVSIGGKCLPDLATVVVPQTPTARAVYNLPGTGQPDRDLVAMQPNTHPQAWLVGVPPGSHYSVNFLKAGCAQLAYPVAFQKMSWLDGFRLQPKALTQVTVFIP
jgi:hypothetical protein